VSSLNQYAASIVEKYRVPVDEESPSHRVPDEIVPLLKQWGKQYLQGITLSGAYPKNTAITLSSHVDLLILLNPIAGSEIKNIFWRLFEYLTAQNLRACTRDVSVRVQRNGLNIDLIPAYRDRAPSGNILFNKRSGEAVHTDLTQHVHVISNSGRQQEICALKIWRERNALDFPSFYLELATLRALENQRFGQLADNIHFVLHYLANRFEQAVIRDPANLDNIVSNELSANAKQSIAKTARDALYEENLEKILR